MESWTTPVSLEQKADDPLGGDRSDLHPNEDDGEDEKDAGEQIEDRLMNDENVDLLVTTLPSAQQRQQHEPVRKRSDRSDPDDDSERTHSPIR